MISVQTAREYASILHPAFAGYYHDGQIQESDALATVFHLVKKGYLEPEFKNNHINQGVAYLRRNARKPSLRFEQQIIDFIFRDSNRVSTPSIGELIKDGSIQTFIAAAATDNFRSITPPAIHEKDYELEVVTTTDQNHRLIQINRRLKRPFLLGALLSSLYALIRYLDQDSPIAIAFLIALAAFFVYAHFFVKNTGDIVSSQVLSYDYSRYYSELQQFLSAHPPRPHTFTYEFIPFAIAFNLDHSWHHDFGLAPTPRQN